MTEESQLPVRVHGQQDLPHVDVDLFVLEVPSQVIDDDVLVDALESGEVVSEDQLPLLLALDLQPPVARRRLQREGINVLIDDGMIKLEPELLHQRPL